MTLDLSKIFVKYSISTAAARAITIAINVEVEALTKRLAELELLLGNKVDKVDSLTHARAPARGFWPL